MTVAGTHEMAVGTTPGAAATGKLRIYPSSVDGLWHQVDESNVDTVLSGIQGASYAATSTTSLAIGTGSKAFTTQAGLAYVVGSRVRAASAADPADFMEGVVTAYTGTTLTVLIDLIGGTGTDADWSISIAGEEGEAAFPVGVIAHGNIGVAETFDFGSGPVVPSTSGPIHTGTMDGDCTITLDTDITTEQSVLEIWLIGDGTVRTLTWDPDIEWQGGSVPTLDYSLGAINRFVFESLDGTAWLGLLTGPGPAGATGSNGAGVVAGGTAGQVLAKIDGTDYNTEWITSAATPSLVLIETITLGAAGTITFDAIPATYKDLVIIGRVRDDAASEIVAAGPIMRVGATTVDSGNNYDYRAHEDATVDATDDGHSQSNWHIARSTNGASATADYWTRLEIEIFDYAETTTFRSFISKGIVMSTTNNRVLSAGGQWRNKTDAIDIIQILGVAAGDLVTGTTFRLYGRI